MLWGKLHQHFNKCQTINTIYSKFTHRGSTTVISINESCQPVRMSHSVFLQLLHWWDVFPVSCVLRSKSSVVCRVFTKGGFGKGSCCCGRCRSCANDCCAHVTARLVCVTVKHTTSMNCWHTIVSHITGWWHKHAVCHIDSFELFKSNLKTHLFKAAFINYL